MSLLTDLNKIDIKDLQNIDYRKLLKKFQKRPDTIICILAIFATLIFSIKFFAKRYSEIKTVKNNITLLEKKTKAIDEYKAVSKELKEYLTNIPMKIGEDDLINHITDIAVSRNIQIASFSPAKSASEELYDLTSIILDITARKYEDLWLFMNDIEGSPYALRIDKWKGSMDYKFRTYKGSIKIESDTIILNVTLEIASLNIKDDK